MAVPSTIGFVVGVGGPPPTAPSLAMCGPRVPLSLRGGGLQSLGWAIQGEPGAPVATAGCDGVTLLLAGELHHRGGEGTPDPGEASGPLTDAEFLLGCWLRYGPAALRLVQGRFAVVILDQGTVVSATDHAGSIPLYLRVLPGRVEVATEAKALAGTAERTSAFADATTFVTAVVGTAPVHGLANVRRVRAGTAVTVDPITNATTAMRTWSPPQHREALAPEMAVARVAEALSASVATRLDTGPVTVVLSGGIDSSAVAALTMRHAAGTVTTVSLGTDAGDEFDAARLVADHLGTTHHEIRVGSEQVIRALPWAVAAAEMVNAEVLEYLLPLVVLYQELPGSRRILTGYGADIPLGGMHRETNRLDSLDAVIAHDMATFDGLNEMSPVLGGSSGHWTTHPYWDRTVLDLLVRLEPGLKRREGIDKWVLRQSVADLLPDQTIRRPKLGIHEGSGTTSTWTAMLKAQGVPDERVAAAKQAMVEAIHRRVVCEGEPPALVDVDEVLHDAVAIDKVVAR